MPKRFLGNIITDTPTEPTGPYQNDTASGVWSPAEANTYNAAGLWPQAGNFLDIAVFFTKADRDLETVQFSTLGNSTDWGHLLHDDAGNGTCANGVKGFYMGGAGNRNDINEITFATGGDAIDYGDLTEGRRRPASTSNNTRGLACGGSHNSSFNIIDYITMASSGNATDFGDCTQYNPAGGHNAAGSTSTRAVFANSGNGGQRRNVIEYVTIATTGNGTDFGDTTTARGITACGNNSTRLVFAGGDTNSDNKTNVIDYVTMASTGNATDFGDLTVARMDLGSASNSTRAIFGGGLIYPSETNVMDYITTATTGNATDFGDLSRSQDGVSGVSSSNPSQAA